MSQIEAGIMRSLAQRLPETTLLYSVRSILQIIPTNSLVSAGEVPLCLYCIYPLGKRHPRIDEKE